MSGSLPDTPAGVHLATGKDKMREACWVFRSLLWERIFTRRSTTGQRLFSLGIVIIPLGALWYIGWPRGRGVEPDGWRVGGIRHCLTQGSCRLDARAEDLVAVRVGVATVHGLSGQVHEHRRALDRPSDADRVIPRELARTADATDDVPVLFEGANQSGPDEAAGTGDDGYGLLCHFFAIRHLASPRKAIIARSTSAS